MQFCLYVSYWTVVFSTECSFHFWAGNSGYHLSVFLCFTKAVDSIL